MAERTAIFNLRINDNNSAKKVADNEKALDKMRKSTENVVSSQKQLDKQFQAINKVVDSNAFSMREANRLINDYQTIAIKAGKDSPIGREAIQRAAELTDRMGKLRNEVRNLSNDGQALQGALAISSATLGGYQAFQGVSAILGVENEALMETMVKLQAVQQVSIGLEQVRKQLEQGSAARAALMTMRTKELAAATFLYSNSQKALTLSLGSSTGAMKLFRLALLATGIGAIVVGIGLLVTNWDRLTASVGNGAKAMREFAERSIILRTIIATIKVAVDALISGLEALGIIESREEKAAKARAEEKAKRVQQEREDERNRVRDRIKGLKDEGKAVDDQLSFEIAKRRAAGKDTIDLERQKMLATIESNKQQIASINDLISAYMEEIKIKMRTGQFTIEERKEIAKLIEARNQLADSIKKTGQDLEVFDVRNKTAASERQQQAIDKERQAEEKRQEELKKIQEKATDLMIQSIEDDEERKRMALSVQHQRERDQLIAKYGEDTELLKELERNQFAELMNLEEELDQIQSQKEKDRAEQEREEELLRLENDLMAMELDFQERMQRELELEELRRDMLLDSDELTAEERRRIEIESQERLAAIRQKAVDEEQAASDAIKAARMAVLDQTIKAVSEFGALADKSGRIQKAAALGEIAANTAMGFARGLSIAQQGATATGPAAPFTFPLFLASQFASVLSAVNKARGILGAGSASAPSAAAPPTTSNNRDNEQMNTRTEQQGVDTTSKVIVTETDISRTQKRVTDIEVRSVF